MKSIEHMQADAVLRKKVYLGQPRLSKDAFIHILSFLRPNDIDKMRAVGKKEKEVIDEFSLKRRTEYDGSESFNLPMAALNKLVRHTAPLKLILRLKQRILAKENELTQLQTLAAVACAIGVTIAIILIVLSLMNFPLLVELALLPVQQQAMQQAVNIGVFIAINVMLDALVGSFCLFFIAWAEKDIEQYHLNNTMHSYLTMLSIRSEASYQLYHLHQHYNGNQAEYPKGIEDEDKFLVKYAVKFGLMKQPNPALQAAVATTDSEHETLNTALSY